MAELDKNAEQKIEQVFRENLQRAYNNGLRVGVYTASKIVLDKLNDTSKPLMKRIRDVQNYCNVPLKNEDKFLGVSGNKANEDANENSENVVGDTVEETETT